MSSDFITHYWGNNAMSPCGRDVSEVYRGVQSGFTSEWSHVDCPTCLAQRPKARS